MSINFTTIHSLQNFKQIIESPIFITCDKRLQNVEISTNMWAISIDFKTLKHMSVDNLLEFIRTLLNKKKQQISQLNISCSVIFYMWFDEMATQLRFNVISGFDEKLPFGCEVNIVNSPDFILKNFLKSQRNPEITWSELEEVMNDSDDIDENHFVLDVFVVQLNNIEFAKKILTI
jgi:hypothetical protein